MSQTTFLTALYTIPASMKRKLTFANIYIYFFKDFIVILQGFFM